MKQWGAFAIILLLLGAALIASQKQRINAPVGPEAVLSLVGDTETSSRASRHLYPHVR